MNPEMKQYIGTKRINAKPMTRLEYNIFRGWELPEDEDGSDEGFLVEYVDGGKANTDAFEGYVSWSPSEVFKRAYREISGMTFGAAIEALKAGERVARAGWNGKGMFIFHVCADSFPTQNDSAKTLFGDAIRYRACIAMKTVNHEVVPWVASQSDILEEDWEIVS